HPLARAIVARAEAMGLPPAEATEVTSIPGRGVRARTRAGLAWVGSARLFGELGAVTGDVRERVAAAEREGRTVVLVGYSEGGVEAGTRISGMLLLADGPRPEAAAAVRDLRRRGIAHVAVLTGDNGGAARALSA